MSNKKWNNFSKLYDYFNEEEESEEEIDNYEKNYSEVLKEKKMKISKETNDDNKENKIFIELNSNDKMIDDDNDVFYFEEKKIRDNENNDFNQIKFASFKPECFNEDYTEKKENIEKSNDLNNYFKIRHRIKIFIKYFEEKLYSLKYLLFKVNYQ